MFVFVIDLCCLRGRKGRIMMSNKSKLSRNAGFSLVEILVAIALLAIVIVPTMQSFITSAIVNKNSRKLMIATDLAQSIVEGFADNDYQDIKKAFGPTGIATASLSGNRALSSISGNQFDSYNMMENAREITFDDFIVSSNKAQITFGTSMVAPLTSQTVSGASLISGNGVPSNGTVLDVCRAFAASGVLSQFTLRSANPTDQDAAKKLFYYGGGDVTLLMYGDVVYDGYHFNVVVAFIPTAKNNLDTTKFYSYMTEVVVYEYDSSYNSATSSLLLSNDPSAPQPLMAIMGGMRAN